MNRATRFLKWAVRRSAPWLLASVLLLTAACGRSPSEQIAAPATGEAAVAANAPTAPDAVRIARDADDLPGPVGPREPQRVVVELETVERVGTMTDEVTYTYWTFNGTVPGPMIRVREGDTVELRITNNPDSGQPHSIDLHAVTGPGGGAEVTQVHPGETKSFEFKAMAPGVYVYHCATPHIPTHVAMGMYGLIVVEPAEGWPDVDKEFYLMQGDFYADLGPRDAGHAKFDGEAMKNEQPAFVVFNGQFQALTGEYAMEAEVGDRVRLFVGNGGVNLVSSFHVIGEIMDVVYREGQSEPVHNVQTTLIPAGGATMVEFTVDVPGVYTLVDHSLSRAIDKGAVAHLIVRGEENPDIFNPLAQ